MPNIPYLMSAANVQQTHLSRPMRELNIMFRAPPYDSLFHMAKLVDHHVVIATQSPTLSLQLVFLSERRSQSSLLSCFGFALLSL